MYTQYKVYIELEKQIKVTVHTKEIYNKQL